MMMILGVSSKVVPTLSGVNVRRTNSLWPTFLLLNLGNLTRVSSQIATDFSPSAYSVMGFSGFIEVVGLAFWGYELFTNMRAGKRLELEIPAAQGNGDGRFQIMPQMKVADDAGTIPAISSDRPASWFWTARVRLDNAVTHPRSRRHRALTMLGSELVTRLNRE
jgi:hypothetical protein